MAASDQNQQWDVAIIGAGMAGAACLNRLAARNITCVVIEAGAPRPVYAPRGAWRSRLRRVFSAASADALPGRWAGAIELAIAGRRLARVPALLGSGTGGGSLVYGAALTRFRPDDFTLDRDPTTWRADADKPLPNAWPVAIEEMERWYTVAEAAMGVRGERDPADPRTAGLAPLPEAPVGGPREQALMAAMRGSGLSPFRLPVGIEYRPGCTECLGFPCPRGCKANAWHRLAPRAASGWSLRTEEACRVIERDGAGGYVVVTQGPGGGERRVRARRVVLAAGALHTPAILQRSSDLWGNRGHPSLLGRGLMFHASDLFAVLPPGRAPASGMMKVMGLRDFYEVDGAPLGEVQSLGVSLAPPMIAKFLRDEARRLGLGPLSGFAYLARIPLGLGRRLLERLAVLATIVEDLPYAENRVEAIDMEDCVRVVYRPSREFTQRAYALRAQIRRRFSGLRPIFLNRAGSLNLGHPMGSCRMGEDPDTSVVDPCGRIRGQHGLYVCDASTFPSSAGTNPGLTVLANALRIGEELALEITEATALNAASQAGA